MSIASGETREYLGVLITNTESGWRRFWNRGRWWKGLILTVGYLVLYEAASMLISPFASMAGKPTATTYVVIFFVVPILFGGIILVVFGASTGWLRELFARQKLGGREWMWIAIVVVLLFNLLRFASIDYGKAGATWVLAWLLAGLLIGFAEETLTRGYVMRIMREAGHSEITVALVSAVLFALLHSVNLFTGQVLSATLLQIVYTFFFGICMYLALRVTRTLIAPILIHASTDPSIFMQGLHPASGPLVAIGGLGNFAVIVVGLVLLVVFIITQRRTDHHPVKSGASA